jgi:hypothetical protein
MRGILDGQWLLKVYGKACFGEKKVAVKDLWFRFRVYLKDNVLDF